MELLSRALVVLDGGRRSFIDSFESVPGIEDAKQNKYAKVEEGV